MTVPDSGGFKFSEYARLILSDIEAIKRQQANQDRRINQLTNDMAQLKVKAGIWGAIGAAGPIAIFVGYELLRRLG